MKSRTIILPFLFFFGIFVTPVYASVNYKGIDGLIDIPSAYVHLPWKAGLGYFYVNGGGSVAANLSLPGGVELAYGRRLSGEERFMGTYSAKITLSKEKIFSPAIAVGAEDLADKERRAYYLVMSKQVPWGIRLHLGAKSARGVFFGLEKQIKLRGDLRDRTPFVPLFTLMLEYDGQNFNYGAYTRNSRGVRFDLAWRGCDDKFMLSAQKEF